MMEQLSVAQQTGLVVGILLLVGLTPPHAFAQVKKTFVAFSMQRAQARVEEAVRQGENFRTTQPDLFYLGGITKPWAVVLDPKRSDWILVGERDPTASVLTLDDWSVALRARFLHGEQDPGVTIDPRPSEACLKAGQKESCRDATRQDVRFFGGIEDTHFGQVCYAADWLMKKIGLGLEKVPVQALKTYSDLAVEQARQARGRKIVRSRFWFYPIVNRVNVLGQVVLLEAFQMGVFTEVLYAEVAGTPVTEVDKFVHAPAEGFARSFSEHYDAAAEAREVLETLRGLTRLAALAQGLMQTAARPQVEFYLWKYPVQQVPTPQEVDVLRMANQEVGLEISGGVHLTALAMRLHGGDVRALQALVMGTRPAAKALSWGFELEMRGGQPTAVRLPIGLADPTQLAPLFQHALFLQKKQHYDAAIAGYGKVLQLNPNDAVAYHNRGLAYVGKGAYDRAIHDFTKAIALNPNLAESYKNRALVSSLQGAPREALHDINRALTLGLTNAPSVYLLRGYVNESLAKPADALADYNAGLAVAARTGPRGSGGKVLADLSFARGQLYFRLGRWMEAIQDYQEARQADASKVEALYREGQAWEKAQYPGQAINAYQLFVQQTPRTEEWQIKMLDALARINTIQNPLYGSNWRGR